MVGRVALATRQILANFQRLSKVSFLRSTQSLSAYKATSSPILFRYLKQSATVLRESRP